MDSTFDFKALGEDRMVYVKSVAVAELPEDVRDQVPDLETLYAVHDSDGEQIALVANRALAFALARQNDMTPVTVH